jgi:hypothetical protein
MPPRKRRVRRNLRAAGECFEASIAVEKAPNQFFLTRNAPKQAALKSLSGAICMVQIRRFEHGFYKKIPQFSAVNVMPLITVMCS